MKFLNRWFQRQPPETLDSDRLRELLLQAHAEGDEQRFATLCRTQQAAILDAFAKWRKVPSAVQSNPALLQRYGDGIVAIARYFGEELGISDLIAGLTANDDTGPIPRWNTALLHSEQLEEDLRYREASNELESMLEEFAGVSGPDAQHYLALTHGHLARTYIQSGQADKARVAAEIALRLCREQNDTEGVVIYLRGLYEVHRHLGNGVSAAEHAQQLADVLDEEGQPDEATRYRKAAQVARRGEPLNRVVVEVEGNWFEVDEVPRITTNNRVRFHFVRNRTSLRTSDVLTQRGNELGTQGKYEEALQAFRDAAAVDVYDPDPHYQSGVTLLHLKRYSEAVSSYEASEQRAPGWFHGCSMISLARQLAVGELSHETFLALRALEDDDEMDAGEKVCLAEQALESVPNLALLHFHLATNLEKSGRCDEALAAFRQGLGMAADPQTRARLLLSRALIDKNSHDRWICLEEAASSKADLIAAATAYLMLRDFPPPAQ